MGRYAQCDNEADTVSLCGSDNLVKVLKPVSARVDRRGLAVPALVIRDTRVGGDLVESPAGAYQTMTV